MVLKIQKDISTTFLRKYVTITLQQSCPSKKYTGSAVDLQNVSENFAKNIQNN